MSVAVHVGHAPLGSIAIVKANASAIPPAITMANRRCVVIMGVEVVVGHVHQVMPVTFRSSMILLCMSANRVHLTA